MRKKQRGPVEDRERGLVLLHVQGGFLLSLAFLSAI